MAGTLEFGYTISLGSAFAGLTLELALFDSDGVLQNSPADFTAHTIIDEQGSGDYSALITGLPVAFSGYVTIANSVGSVHLGVGSVRLAEVANNWNLEDDTWSVS